MIFAITTSRILIEDTNRSAYDTVVAKDVGRSPKCDKQSLVF